MGGVSRHQARSHTVTAVRRRCGRGGRGGGGDRCAVIRAAVVVVEAGVGDRRVIGRRPVLRQHQRRQRRMRCTAHTCRRCGVCCCVHGACCCCSCGECRVAVGRQCAELRGLRGRLGDDDRRAGCSAGVDAPRRHQGHHARKEKQKENTRGGGDRDRAGICRDASPSSPRTRPLAPHCRRVRRAAAHEVERVRSEMRTDDE